MLEALAVLLFVFAWIGHAYILTSFLNNLYGRPFPKNFLKPWRFITGVAILAFPLLLWMMESMPIVNLGHPEDSLQQVWAALLFAYVLTCLFFGIVYLQMNIVRYLRKPSACVLSEETRTLDLWPELGEKL